MGRLTGIDTVLLLDLDGTLYVVARPGPHGAVHHQHRLDPPDRPRRPPGRAGPGERATHIQVADPSYRATYDDLNAAFRALRSEAQLVTTRVNRIARRDNGEHHSSSA